MAEARGLTFRQPPDSVNASAKAAKAVKTVKQVRGLFDGTYTDHPKGHFPHFPRPKAHSTLALRAFLQAGAETLRVTFRYLETQSVTSTMGYAGLVRRGSQGPSAAPE